MSIATYLAIGGPLNGHRVTEQYAGDEYHRFNSADKVPTRPCGWCKKGAAREQKSNGTWVHTHPRLGRFVCSVQDPNKPRGVLVHGSLWEATESKE